VRLLLFSKWARAPLLLLHEADEEFNDHIQHQVEPGGLQGVQSLVMVLNSMPIRAGHN
jgi:hypothetical protein